MDPRKNPADKLRNRIEGRRATLAKWKDDLSRIQANDDVARACQKYYRKRIQHSETELAALTEQLGQLGG